MIAMTTIYHGNPTAVSRSTRKTVSRILQTPATFLRADIALSNGKDLSAYTTDIKEFNSLNLMRDTKDF
jgi:hypothetical protein